MQRRGQCSLGAGLFIAGAVFIAALYNLPPLAAAPARSLQSVALAGGENPYPIRLVRPPAKPLSAMAQLGRLLFFDANLSSSGRLSCASCHSPQHAYAAPGDLPVMRGGPLLSRQGVRAVPSLMYLERQPSFSIGPDNEENENVSLGRLIALSRGAVPAPKIAAPVNAAALNRVPQGGLFWDGRADTLQDQALVPLLDPREMDGGSIEAVAGKLRHARYAQRFTQLFGHSLFDDARLTVAEALFAVARYQIEAVSFHPYTSKFDDWLEGKARLSANELRGYLLFNDPAKANCGGCHVDQPRRDGLPPLFTDHQFEALGVPRNGALAINRDLAYSDLGICGPYRRDMIRQIQYCGLFATPTLRNVATRKAFFHNGVYRTLRQVLDFYAFRDTAPQKIYPHGPDGAVQKFNDLPPRYRGNIDSTDPPLNRKAGDTPAMTARDENDIIAFLNILTDGYARR
jgi:cytochrome c peroxidase